MSLIKHLFHRPTWQKLPKVPRWYSTDFDHKGIDPDVARLMQMSHIRSPHVVKMLMRKYGVDSPRELAAVLPARRHHRRVGARLLALIRRAFGVTPYDPMVEIARRHRPPKSRRFS